MKKINVLTIFAVVLIFAIWTYSFFSIPTFDLDESLYRRAAEEMKWHGNYWLPKWNLVGLYHKPPILYWLIALFSKIFDGNDAGVSILAARLPSFLATLGILFSLGSARKKISDSFLLWGCALFALITSTSVLYDPLQTLTLIPFLLIAQKAFSEQRAFTRKEYLGIAVSAFLASATKGLNGIILPTFAIAVHTLIVNGKDFRKTIHDGWRFLMFSFIPAAALTTLYYLFLDRMIGRPFTEEFFLIHHLGRGTQAMESHHGPFYYYIPVALLSAGLLLPLLTFESLRTRFSFKRWGFGLTFTFTTLFFYSISATKLPHYTWPIWPALVLFLLDLQNQSTQNLSALNTWKVKLSFIPILLVSGALFFFISRPEILSLIQIQDEEVFCFTVAGTLIWITVIFSSKFLRSLERYAFMAVMIAAFLAVPLGSIAKRLLDEPLVEVAQALKAASIPADQCIRYSGPQSASLSLILSNVLGKEYTHNRCEPGEMKILISPQKKKVECDELNFKIIFENQFFAVCRKPL